jgi:peptidoglycan/xylan/chitin deacetylase (PgdA/CDA1 family)
MSLKMSDKKPIKAKKAVQPKAEQQPLAIKPKKTKRSWRRLSVLPVVCVLVAVSYLGYRVYLLTGPKGIRGVLHSQVQAPVVIGCKADGDESVSLANRNAFPPVPADYQAFIQSQPSLEKNLVKNASMKDYDRDAEAPVGFHRTIETDWVDYKFLYEEPGHKPFLRTTTSQPIGPGDVAPGWIMDAILLKPQGTYVYDFEYRSNAKALVSIEYRLHNGLTVYENVAELEPKDAWQSFTLYTQNLLQAKSLRFVVVLEERGQLDTRSYDVHSIQPASLDEGMVSIAFDDGWQSIDDKAWPLLTERAFRTTQYIIGEASGKSVPGYMDMKTLDKFRQAGHEIGSHTLNHCDQTKLSHDSMQENAEGSKQLLKDEELGPITSFAYPYGAYSQATRQVFSQHYNYMRSSDVGYNDRYFDAQNIRTMSVLNTTKDSEVKAWLDYAKEHRLWLVITYHRVDEHGSYSVTSQQLERQLDLIRASRLRVLPVTQAAETIR